MPIHPTVAEQARRLTVFFLCAPKEQKMDRDRIKGMGDQAKGSMKEAAGKVTGDSKLQAEGKMDKAKGKIENAVGGMKDSLRRDDMDED